MNLNVALRILEQKQGAAFSVHVLHPAFLECEALRLAPDQYLHHGEFCRNTKMHGGDAVCVMDQVRDNKNTDEDWLEQIALKEAMARLSKRERQILALRYSDGKTQMEVSSEIGISQAQVSRLEKNAIKSIKKNM